MNENSGPPPPSKYSPRSDGRGPDGGQNEFQILVPVPPTVPRPNFQSFDHLTTAFEHRLADGQTAFFVLRFDPPGKEKQLRPYSYAIGPTGKGEWVFRLPPKPLPLYLLPELVDRPDAEVLVVEGQKTAEAARTKFPDFAVTTSGGATSAKNFSWAPVEGRILTVLPDADQPGAKYAQDVAEQAYQAGAKEVRIVDLPKHLPQGWDLADPFPENFTEQELRHLILGAPVCPAQNFGNPGRAEHHGPLLKLSMARLREAPAKPREWLWAGLIPLGVPGLVGGVSDHGKTSLMLQLAAGVAMARPVLGRETVHTPRGVLMVFLEDDSEDEVKPRIDAVAETFESWTEQDEANYRKYLWPFVPDWDFTLDMSFGRLHEELDHQLGMMILEGIQPALLVLDTFAAVSDGSENEASSSRVLWAVARALSRKFRVTVVFTHHLRKEGQIGRDKSPIHERLHPSMLRGTSANEGSARFVFQMGWVTWEEAERVNLDPEKAYNLGYAIGRVSKVKAAKPELIFLDRIDPGDKGEGCFRLYPEGEKVVAELFRNKGKLQELGLQLSLLIELSKAAQPIDRDLVQRAIFGDGPKAKKSLENALARLRMEGFLKPRSMEVTDQGRRHIQEVLSETPGHKTAFAKTPTHLLPP